METVSFQKIFSSHGTLFRSLKNIQGKDTPWGGRDILGLDQPMDPLESFAADADVRRFHSSNAFCRIGRSLHSDSCFHVSREWSSHALGENSQIR
jgi:hypothetical protein